MNESKDFLDDLCINYLRDSPGTPSIFSEHAELTRSQLAEIVSKCTDIINSSELTSGGFIVLHGANSPTQLAWVFSAILNRVPFCLESDESGNLSSTLLHYGDVLKVNTDSFTYTFSKAKHEIKERPCRSQWAYIVNTSGSTGRPKIIPISRANLQAALESFQHFCSFPSDEAWLWEHRLSFDAALWEIFGAIRSNASLNITSSSVADWGRREISFLKDRPAQIVTLTPSELKSLSRLGENSIQHVLADVKSLIFCGERLGWDSLRLLPKWISPSRVRLYNGYGPSEATIICFIHQISESDFNLPSVPIGNPTGDTTFRIDELTGELFISGSQVFSGYLGVKNDWGKEYATGDIVETRDDGSIVFKNRIAGYLNVNGKRLDPRPTIEALCGLPEVIDAYIWAKNDPPFDQIIAAIKTDQVNQVDTKVLRSTINQAGVKVIPTKFHLVPANEWPITTRGKMDSRALIKKVEEAADYDRK